MTEGEEGEYVYILLKGKAEVMVRGVSSTLSEGSTFGEMVMFGQKVRLVTVRATTLCICNAVHKDFFQYAFKLYPTDPNSVHSTAADIAARPLSTRVEGSEMREARG